MHETKTVRLHYTWQRRLRPRPGNSAQAGMRTGTDAYETWHETGQEVAELLLANGDDVNARDNKGRTPLRIAVETKHSKVEAILSAYGAKE